MRYYNNGLIEITDGIYKYTDIFQDGCLEFYSSFAQKLFAIVPGARLSKENDLYAGELEAVEFNIGSFMVRVSTRIYVVVGPGCSTCWEKPASYEETERFRSIIKKHKEKDFCDDMVIARFFFDDPDIRHNMKLTTEVCAKIMSNPAIEWSMVCRAEEAEDRTWYENIINIVSARNSYDIDGKECLYVGFGLYSDFVSAETWHRFEG